MDISQVNDFARRYAAAWCSQNPASVASFYSENGSLKINQGEPSTGRHAIAAGAQQLMTAFPDMIVTMDKVDGTCSGPGGTGNAVRISGYEEWGFGSDGLIARSKGHFDEADYERQLAGAGGTSKR